MSLRGYIFIESIKMQKSGNSESRIFVIFGSSEIIRILYDDGNKSM